MQGNFNLDNKNQNNFGGSPADNELEAYLKSDQEKIFPMQQQDQLLQDQFKASFGEDGAAEQQEDEQARVRRLMENL